MKGFGLSVVFSLAIICAAAGQKIQPKGQFLQDSMAIGEPVQYSLSLRYPKNLEILFPDSLYNYAPFEYTSKKFFTTQSDSLQSFDSVVYTLTSFEIDKVQRLRLPVFLIEKKDSTVIYSAVDSLFLKEKISVVSDSLSLKTETLIMKLDKDFNYPYFIAFWIVLGIIVLLIILIFGKRIRKKWKIWRLNKRHEKFKLAFQMHLGQKEELSSPDVEKLLFRWKKHVEYVSRNPYAKLTSKEIYELQKDEELFENLKLIDKSIYSSKGKKDATAAFEFLISYADVILEQRINRIADGK